MLVYQQQIIYQIEGTSADLRKVITITVEDLLGYHFYEKNILDRALTRGSYASSPVHEKSRPKDQDLYVFLGNSVLKTVLTDLLIRSGLDDTDDVKRYLEEACRDETVAALVQDLSIERFIRVDPEESRQSSNMPDNILIETGKAIIGAIFLDGGYEAAEQRIKRWMGDYLP